MNKTKKKKILGRAIVIAMITATFMLVFPMTASAATGDDCTAPIVVSIPGGLPYTDTDQTTCGRVDDYKATCLGSYDGGEDIIYRFDVTADTCIDIEMDPKGTGWTGLMIDDNCPGDDATCIASDTGSSGTRELSSISLTAGNSYYIMVDTYPAPDCIPDFDLTITECAGPSPGDDCDHPIYIDIPADLTYTNSSYTCDRGNDYSSTCLGNYDGGEDIIYQLNVTSDTTIDVTLDPKDTTYTGILIDDECPDTGVCINSSTNSGSSPHGFTADLTAGTYYIMVDTWPAPDCIPDFDLTIERIEEKPDLVITEKTEEWVNATHYNINYTVCNIGNANAGASNTTIFIDGVNVMEVPTPALGPNECSTSIIGPFECPHGCVLNVTVCADNLDEVDESDEDNNCKVNTLLCPGAGIICDCGDICVNTTGWWCNNSLFNPSGTPIHDVVNDASVCCGTCTCEDPCGICVKDGTYYENVDVATANLVIKSQNGYASTIVQAANPGDHVFDVTADCVTIQGFTVTGAGTSSGIHLGSWSTYADHCNILYNSVSGNGDNGIYVEYGNHNEIMGNIANNNGDDGIRVDRDNNNVTNNIANENGENGIKIYYADYCIVTDNIANDNGDFGIDLYSADYNTVADNTANNNDMGIHLNGADNNEISGNTVKHNTKDGIYLYDSDDNNITCNLVAYNDRSGFHLCFGSWSTSTGNDINYNNIVSNGVCNATSGGWEWNFHNEQSVDNVDAENNYWCRCSVKNASINEDPGTVDSDPFLSDPSGCAPMQPCTPCTPPEPGIEVNKTVLDGTAWVKEIQANVCDTVRFRCEIHNNGTCCDLTNITVTDILSDSLEYKDNATVDGVPQEPTQTGPNKFEWEFPGPLAPCETITIEFGAHVIECGNDTNTQNATAWCEETGTWVSDKDTVWVNCTQNPLWKEINAELDSLKGSVSAATMPSIIQRRLVDKLEYAKALKENAKVECEAGNFEGATKKLGVAKSQVESFASMVKITRRISPADKASFLADSTEIIGKIQALIEYIETEHKC